MILLKINLPGILLLDVVLVYNIYAVIITLCDSEGSEEF